MANAQSAMLSGPTMGIYLKFLLPAISAMLINSVYSIIDTIFIGIANGEVGLSALTVCLPIFTLVNALGVAIGVGGSILYSVAKGKGDQKSKVYFTAAAVFALVMGAILAIALNIFLDPVLRTLGASGEIFAAARPFARNLAIILPAMLFSQFMVVFVRNDGAPAIAMIAMVANGLLNILFDYIFVIVLKMGMPGTIWATLVGVAASLLVCSTRFFAKSSGLRPSFSGGINVLPAIILAGGATFIMDFAPAVTTILFNNMLNKYGGENVTSYMASYGVICNVVAVFVTMFSAVCLACQPLMSINHGADNDRRARKFLWLGMVTVLFLGLVLYAAAAISPQLYLKMFAPDYSPTTLQIVPRAVRLYGIVLFIAGFNLLIGYFFQSTLEKGRSLLISLLRGVAFTVLFVLLLPMIFGIDSIWLAIPLAEAATLIIAVIVWRFFPSKGQKELNGKIREQKLRQNT